MSSLFQDKHQLLQVNGKPARFNLSTYFLYPSLNIRNLYTMDLYDTYLYNTTPIETREELLYIVYRFDYFLCQDGLINNDNYINLKAYLTEEKQDYYFTDYIIKDINKEETSLIKDDYCCFVMKIPQEFKGDYYSFLRGEYSRLSNNLKERLTQNYNIKEKANLCEIVTKDVKRRLWLEKVLNVNIERTAELCDIPDKDMETFDYKKLETL